MKKIQILISIILAVTIILTILNLTYLIEITKDSDLRGNFYLNKEINDNYYEIEKIHMQEVKQLVLFSIGLNIILFLIVKYHKKNTNPKITGYSILSIMILLSIPALISFQTFFTNFHLIFFNSNNWLLPPDSLLVQHYNLDYYKAMILKISIILVFISFLLINLNKLIPKNLTKTNN